jgi:hypothetical protein
MAQLKLAATGGVADFAMGGAFGWRVGLCKAVAPFIPQGKEPPHSKGSWRNGRRGILLDEILRFAQDDDETNQRQAASAAG